MLGGGNEHVLCVSDRLLQVALRAAPRSALGVAFFNVPVLRSPCWRPYRWASPAMVVLRAGPFLHFTPAGWGHQARLPAGSHNYGVLLDGGIVLHQGNRRQANRSR